MKKMPTAKQTRFHYKKCRRAFYKLLIALNDAHNANVIDYKEKKNEHGYMSDTLESVCEKVYEAKHNFEVATHDQLAKAMKDELMNELKGVW